MESSALAKSGRTLRWWPDIGSGKEAKTQGDCAVGYLEEGL
jgi:hypothetical protein